MSECRDGKCLLPLVTCGLSSRLPSYLERRDFSQELLSSSNTMKPLWSTRVGWREGEIARKAKRAARVLGEPPLLTCYMVM